MDRGNLWATIQGVTESDTTERLTLKDFIILIILSLLGLFSLYIRSTALYIILKLSFGGMI